MNKRMIHEFSNPKIVRTESKIMYGSYEIILPQSYPFSPPKIKRDNEDIYNKLCKLFYKYKPFIDDYKVPVECICCTTLCCRWSPCNKIIDVMNEVNDYSYKIKTIHSCKYVFHYLPFDQKVNSCILQYLL